MSGKLKFLKLKYSGHCNILCNVHIGTAEHSFCESLSGKKSDIPGLEYRVDNPLEFLGLYHTMHNACRRHDIPAKIVIFLFNLLNCHY